MKQCACRCLKFDGDSEMTDRSEIANSNVILTTFEKWEAFTRNSENFMLASTVGLLLIDEFHIIGEERGAFLEAVMIRMKNICQDGLRIVAVSATIPNIIQVTQWLTNNFGASKSLEFDQSFRATPIDKYAIGYSSEGNYLETRSKINNLLIECIQKYSSMKSSLIVGDISNFSFVHPGKIVLKRRSS